MSPIVRKVAIIVAVVALLIVAYFVSNSHGHRKFVNTTGKMIILSDTTSPGSGAAGHAHIWSANIDGSGMVALTGGNETDQDPSYSPDGSTITFVSDRKGSPELWVMNGDGSDPDQITIGNDSKSSPKYSPDGKQIAYISRGALTTVDLDSRTQNVLLPIPQQGNAEADPSAPQRQPVTTFAWAPVAGQNGSLLAAVQDSDTGVEQLTLVGGFLTTPVPVVSGTNISFVWAPDGSRLLVSVIGLAGIKPPANAPIHLPAGMVLMPAPKQLPPSGIYTFGVDGSLQTSTPPIAAAAQPTVGPQDPAISPDAKLIAFEIWPTANAEVNHYLGIATITMDESARQIFRLNGPTASPSFSADGKLFGFTAPSRTRHAWRDAYSIGLSASKISNLTNDQLNVIEYAFSPAHASK